MSAVAKLDRAQAVDVIVFARRPRPGHVKTRLSHDLGRQRAASVYAGLLRRTLAIVERASFGRRVLMPAAIADLDYFHMHYAHRGWRVRPQCAGNLARRMAHALGRQLGANHAALLIGSDIADFKLTDLCAARAALAAGADAVVGPAQDGGYWLIGLSRPIAGLFHNMPWSSSRLYQRTIRHFEREQLDWVELATRRDVDTIGDLRGLARAPQWRGVLT